MAKTGGKYKNNENNQSRHKNAGNRKYSKSQITRIKAAKVTRLTKSTYQDISLSLVRVSLVQKYEDFCSLVIFPRPERRFR